MTETLQDKIFKAHVAGSTCSSIARKHKLPLEDVMNIVYGGSKKFLHPSTVANEGSVDGSIATQLAGTVEALGNNGRI